jgi:NAD(P)-dependent dehydrogenase (short-subunit alcohol dehydrogenase family)
MQEFAGRVAVVTGSASGIGFGLAERFGAEGMKVVLADIEPDDLDRAVRDLISRGYEVTGEVTDVSKQGQLQKLAQATVDRYGAVHVLCNNAGVQGVVAPIFQYTAKDWEWVIGVNLWGVIWGMQAFLPVMMAQDVECHIVNTSSMAGLAISNSVYGVSKHAVVALSEAYYCDLKAAGSKVGVSVLLPGVTQTAIFDSARHRPPDLVDPDTVPPPPEVAQMIEQLRSQGGRFGAGHGQTPTLVAEKVLDCIRKGSFWVVPNERWRRPALTRIEGVFEGRNPLMLDDALPGFPGVGW